MKVLIADDSSVSRRLLEATLVRWDYEVVAACDGAQAWEVLQQPDGPTLAILDWVMPSHTGPEVCRLVRNGKREQYVYLILLTSKALKEDLIEGMEAGADDYLIKPFDQHELKVRLLAGHRILDLQAELVAAREALRVQATRDALTGLWNRRAILEILHTELNRSEREHTHVGVVLCDLDHFKRVNDTYGHAVGDAVLQEAARRMNDSVRAYDAVGRYGGEEFLMVLPGCKEDDAAHQADRLRVSLATRPVVVSGGDLMVTASFGSTSWLSTTRASIEAIIGVADEALYQAKRQGRNRVVSLAADQALASR